MKNIAKTAFRYDVGRFHDDGVQHLIFPPKKQNYYLYNPKQDSSDLIFNLTVIMLRSAILVLSLVAALTLGQDDPCMGCDSATLFSTGGIDDEFPRYEGSWERMGFWEGRPFYQCSADCQGLRDQLVRKDSIDAVVLFNY